MQEHVVHVKVHSEKPVLTVVPMGVVADDVVSLMRKVSSDLVHTSGQGVRPNERITAGVMTWGALERYLHLANPFIFRLRFLEFLFEVFAQGIIDDALSLFGIAPNYSEVGFSDVLVDKLLLKEIGRAHV